MANYTQSFTGGLQMVGVIIEGGTEWHVYFQDNTGCVIMAKTVKVIGESVNFYEQEGEHGLMGHVATLNWADVRAILREPMVLVEDNGNH